MTSNRPKERSLGQTSVWAIESGLAQDNLEIMSMIHLVITEYKAFEHFPIALSENRRRIEEEEVRSENWPDLRPLKWKFRDIRFVGTNVPINCCKFHVDPLKTFSHGAIGNIFVGWVNWPDLVTWDDLGLKLSKWCGKNVWKGMQKNGGAAVFQVVEGV